MEKFGSWFGSLPHPHKVVIGGNHDWVMQALGKKEVFKILAKYCSPGSFVYLDHEDALVGTLKVFGSPYAVWGSHNDAFMSPTEDFNYDAISENTHIVVTHMPAILPRSHGLREDKELVGAMHRVGALLHVGGHCHWAHGLYHSKEGHIPCVVASVCDSHWISPLDLFFGDSVERGDQEGDLCHGGYNLFFPPIVCDLLIPGGPPPDNAPWITNSMVITKNSSPSLLHTIHQPTLLFFGPPTDTSAVKRLLPLFCQNFNVSHFDDVEEAIVSVRAQSVPFNVCVSKLGSRGNLGKKLMEIIREVHGDVTFIIVHSATAASDKKMRMSLEKSVGVNMFVDHSCEERLFKKLMEFVNSDKGQRK